MSQKRLYVSSFANININIIKFELYTRDCITKYFDVVDFLNVDQVDITKYQLVLINAIVFFDIIKPDDDIFQGKMEYLSKTKNVVVLLHDLHDYSLYLNKESYDVTIDNIYKNKTNIPILSETNAKKSYNNFFIKYNIKSIISLYDCPEYKYFTQYFKSIDNFYLINHPCTDHIFRPLTTNKDYDILFYGACTIESYPFRCRIYELCKNLNLRIKYIHPSEPIFEDDLCHLINKSWLCIVCVSNFSYFVKKYLEISACNSLVVGNINPQGFKIIESNMIYVEDKMLDSEILDKISYYLENKEIITVLVYNKLENVEKETYKLMADRLNSICSSILNKTKSSFLYSDYLNTNQNLIIPNIRHSKKLINILFKYNSNFMISDKKLVKGLYACIIDNPIIDSIKIYDISGTLLVREDVHFRDSSNPDILYVPFKLNNDSHIKVSQICDQSAIHVYNIYY